MDNNNNKSEEDQIPEIPITDIYNDLVKEDLNSTNKLPLLINKGPVEIKEGNRIRLSHKIRKCIKKRATCIILLCVAFMILIVAVSFYFLVESTKPESPYRSRLLYFYTEST